MIILWRVTNHCNLACPFCAYDKRLGLPRQDADPDEVARFIALLGAWRRRTGRPALLSWLGGEPLLWSPRAALDALAVQHGVGLSLTTNGTQLGSRGVRAALVRDYREVTISIDGPAAFHDAMRSWKGAFGKLSQFIPALASERDAAGTALKIRANVVLMRDNVSTFAELCGALAGWGVDEISFNQLGGRDRPEFHPAHRLRAVDLDALAALLPSLRAALTERGARLVGGRAYFQRLADAALGRPRPIHDCRVAESFIFIDEAGRVAPCSFAPEHFGVNVDQLRTVEQIDALPRRLCALQRATPAPDCADCPSTQQFSKFAAPAA